VVKRGKRKRGKIPEGSGIRRAAHRQQKRLISRREYWGRNSKSSAGGDSRKGGGEFSKGKRSPRENGPIIKESIPRKYPEFQREKETASG